jgi:hypothetical protein
MLTGGFQLNAVNFEPLAITTIRESSKQAGF